jgi:hypothetical protein
MSHNKLRRDQMKSLILYGKISCFIVILMLAYDCSCKIIVFEQSDRQASIFPDYSDVTLPPNIAPANFCINEIADKFIVKIHSRDRDEININSRNGVIKIPSRKWKKLLMACRGTDKIRYICRKKRKLDRIQNYYQSYCERTYR